MLRGKFSALISGDDWINFIAMSLSLPSTRAKCPVCSYAGPFLQHANQPREICPQCHSRARHRVIFFSLEELQKDWSLKGRRVLHVAPEEQIGQLLMHAAGTYVTGDINPIVGCDLGLDLRNLPMPNSSFDMVFTSHVLEHIVEDYQALSEIYRVLRPGGVAILVVPIAAPKTIDYGFADPTRNFHVRTCGLDYFDRYRKAGFMLSLYNTDNFLEPERHALASWRNGERTIHWIPICRKV